MQLPHIFISCKIKKTRLFATAFKTKIFPIFKSNSYCYIKLLTKKNSNQTFSIILLSANTILFKKVLSFDSCKAFKCLQMILPTI